MIVKYPLSDRFFRWLLKGSRYSIEHLPFRPSFLNHKSGDEWSCDRYESCPSGPSGPDWIVRVVLELRLASDWLIWSIDSLTQWVWSGRERVGKSGKDFVLSDRTLIRVAIYSQTHVRRTLVNCSNNRTQLAFYASKFTRTVFIENCELLV